VAGVGRHQCHLGRGLTIHSHCRARFIQLASEVEIMVSRMLSANPTVLAALFHEIFADLLKHDFVK
jgi:hypothetical protein